MFKRYSNLIKEYRFQPILGLIVDEIDAKMLNARIKQIFKVLYSYEAKEIEILLGLFEDKKNALVEYIGPKLICHLVEEINPPTVKEELYNKNKQLRKYELLNFNDGISVSP